ncbi:MAG: hypothetical protein LBT36_01965 [Oscillospiraceae bacterium]|jgi:hypothetical protein|nr:hypothetical protein [Oscillospiraceae bacterium]
MTTNEANAAPKILAVITDRDEAARLEAMFREKRAEYHVTLGGVGTARSEILKALGLSGTEKSLCACVLPAFRVPALMTAVAERLEFSKPGRGIAFSLPVSALSAAVAGEFAAELGSIHERTEPVMEKGMDGARDETRYTLVLAIMNQGFSDTLMNAARKAGAGGGTILNARGTVSPEREKFYGISIQAEKEIVAIIIEKERQRELLRALNAVCGVNTPAHGILLALPIESCEGLMNFQNSNP